MAVQWMDNYQQYGTTAAFMLDGAYIENVGSNPLATDPDVLATGKVLRTDYNFSAWPFQNMQGLRRQLTSSQTTVGIMARLWMSQVPTQYAYAPGMEWRNVANTVICRIIVNPVGGIAAYNAAGTKIGETSAPVLTANAWSHVEAKLFQNSAAGTLEIRVNTQTCLTLTGLALGTNPIAQVVMGYWQDTNVSVFGTWYWKDFAIWDGTGTLNNTFLGSCFVYSMRPDSDVSGTWTITGGAGSAFASLNELSPDDDTKYISSPWPAATADVLTLTDLPADATTVKALMAFVRSKKSDGGDGNLQVSLVSGASTGDGADRPITVAYTYWSDVFETDPATSAQWTVAAANAVKIKFNRTL